MDREINYTNEFFFLSRDEILKNLKTNKTYSECSRESEKLWEDVPILMELFEGKNMQRTVELTAHERQAIRRFIELQEDIHDMVEREQYYRGHRDCLLYLIRCGIFESE